MPESRRWLRRVAGAMLRPEYVYRPVQLYRRAIKARLIAADRVRLAWGLPITGPSDCCISRDIAHLGVFDKTVAEAIWRLLDAGELAVDVGANIGQNTSVMAGRVGPAGHVHAVEAHPAINTCLAHNASRWRRPGLADITVHPVALGASEGTVHIHEPRDFATNSGSASLLAERGAGVSYLVPMTTLDEIVGVAGRIGVLKIDVEGYEAEVLRGAPALLAAHAVRDIVFEDTAEQQPSAVRRLLVDAGFSIFLLDGRFSGPRLAPPGPVGSATQADYLATLDPERAMRRFRPRGWRCLRRLVD